MQSLLFCHRRFDYCCIAFVKETKGKTTCVLFGTTTALAPDHVYSFDTLAREMMIHLFW